MYRIIIGFCLLISNYSVAADPSSSESAMPRWTLIAEPFGFGPGGFVYGLGVGYRISDESMILLEAEKNFFNHSYGDVSGGHMKDWTGSAVGIHYKFFATSSFYGKVGIDSIQFSQTDTGSTPDPSYSSSSVATSFAIGNQWTWTHFTLGCDWIGWVKPIYSTRASESLSGYAQFLRFYLGAAF